MASFNDKGFAADTIDPSRLSLPDREHELSFNEDNRLPSQMQDANLVTPIFAGDQPENAMNELWPSFIDPEAGQQSLLLDYSSYSSSPADPMFGWQNLVQRFDQHNIGLSNHGSFDQSALSRNNSSSSFQHDSRVRFGSSRVGKRVASGSSRGRLVADMSATSPETVYEDSDSHHSWTAADNMELWCLSLRERLISFRRCRERVSLITSHLQTRQRRKVHSMANLWGLSHMSFGTGREKRMLVCKSELVRGPPTAAASAKRWNPSRNNWSLGLVDPRVVLFDLISPKMTPIRFIACLEQANLPTPQKVTIDCFSPIKRGITQPVATAYALFATADDAMEVLIALDGTKPNWNSLEIELECDYVHFPPGFELTETVFEHFDTLPEALRAEKRKLREVRIIPNDKTSALYSSDEESDHANATLSSPTHASRKTSNSSTYSRDPGYVSAGSNRSVAHSDYSSRASTPRKRKRIPKILGGFPCTFSDCGKTFDRDGDRRKHEKNHAAARPHVCERCGKSFLFPKDLRRHMLVHSLHVLSSPEDAVEAAEVDVVSESKVVNRVQPTTVSSLTEAHLKQLYGESGPPDRRISRISSFG